MQVSVLEHRLFYNFKMKHFECTKRTNFIKKESFSDQNYGKPVLTVSPTEKPRRKDCHLYFGFSRRNAAVFEPRTFGGIRRHDCLRR